MNGWVYTFHQIGFIPTELNMVSHGFNLDFSPHQTRFILMISNLLGWQVEFMLMISNLLGLSTWIDYVIFTSDLNFYSNWLPSGDYNFLMWFIILSFAGEYGWIDVFGWMEEWIHMDRWFILLIKLASYPMKK